MLGIADHRMDRVQEHLLGDGEVTMPVPRTIFENVLVEVLGKMCDMGARTLSEINLMRVDLRSMKFQPALG